MSYPKRSPVRQMLSDAGWAPVLFFLVGLAVLIPALYLLSQPWALQTRGVQVTGQVERLWQTVDRCGDKNLGTCTNLHVAYDFDAGGPLSHDATTVGDALFATLHDGGPIAVT